MLLLDKVVQAVWQSAGAQPQTEHTSGGLHIPEESLGTTLRHHTGCSQPQWQLNMPTPPFPSCIYRIWVFMNPEMMWSATTPSREKLCDHMGHQRVKGRTRGCPYNTSPSAHVAQRQWSPMPACPSTRPSNEQQKGRNHLKG